jgi:hypothetical protein
MANNIKVVVRIYRIQVTERVREGRREGGTRLGRVERLGSWGLVEDRGRAAGPSYGCEGGGV